MTTETEIAERLARLIQSYGPKSLEFERLHAAFKLGEEASLARVETLSGLLREARDLAAECGFEDFLARLETGLKETR